METSTFEIFKETNSKLDSLISSVASLDAKMTAVLGNGQPGRLQILEQDVRELKSDSDKDKGARKVVWGFMGLSGLGEIIFHWLTRKP